MRFSPIAGTHCVLPIADSAFLRRSFFSIEMNHCGVVRKMTGAFERHECG
jgi:hypothetical protein